MRYRDSRRSQRKFGAGEIYKITVDLWATSNVFLAGHQLRMDISSSNYPRFDRNLNTGETDIAHATRVLAATNTILHDRAHPSAAILSVLPNSCTERATLNVFCLENLTSLLWNLMGRRRDFPNRIGSRFKRR